MFKKSKIALFVAAAATIFTLTGCLGDSNKTDGTFACIKTVYKYNTGEISKNKWVNEILFIIPGGICYGIGGFLDIIVFNSIQFWTGDNPLLAKDVNGVEYQFAKTDSNTITLTNLSTNEVAEIELNAEGNAIVAVK